MQNVTAPELARWIADSSRTPPLLLDVREQSEYQICHLDNAMLIPMNAVPGRMAELDADAEIVCICHHGGRSMQVANFLERNGFTKVTNLTGGVHAWSQQVDSSMPTY
ncbi:MAG TPA: rhodanese-like domain-containing protein [Burkholderiaceae bacterium]|jgi:rhodanese-related sulfurtransferase|nr:rhodanese-like domain-containing protein [Burkholderiaceae bacterium]